MLRRLFKWVIALVIVWVLVQLSTYGWRPLGRYSMHLSDEERETAGRLQETVAVLAEDIGPRNYQSLENLQAAADYIRKSFGALGYDVDMIPYVIQGQEYHNIVARKPGSSDSKDVVIVGAHYDSCFNPGADDNASGVAGLMELARRLKDRSLNSELRFVAFVNEEPPFFMTESMGSRVYARQVKEANEQIRAVIVLEMLGFYSEQWGSQKYLPLLGPFYPNQADFIAVIGDFHSADLVREFTSGWTKHSDFPLEGLVAPGSVPGINFSDHASFWKEGFAAVMVTDTAYMRNVNYHRKTDLPNTLNYEKMAVVVHGLTEVVGQLAGSQSPEAGGKTK